MSLYQCVRSSPVVHGDPSGLQATAPADYTGEFRSCCLFARNQIKGPADIGSHANKPTATKDGIIFTCRCGWLDTGHIRQSMDVFLKMHTQLKTKATAGTKIAGLEVTFTLAKDVSPKDFSTIAGSMAYDEGFLHEMKTYRPKDVVQIPGVFNSAFSPEDIPSNITGVYLAQSKIGAMVRSADWPAMMDAALQGVLKECEALPQDKGKEVWDAQVKDKWVTGSFPRITLLKRNTSNMPWNIACKQCAHVKDKSVPTWLKKGIVLDRPTYGIGTQIDDAMKRFRDHMKKTFGPGHQSPL